MATPTAPAIENTDEFEGIDLDDYEPTQSGKYDRHVRATLARDEQLAEDDPEAFEGGKRTRVSITVPRGKPAVKKAGHENDDDTFPDVDGEVRQFQDAARSHDRTARKVGTVVQGDGYVKVSFILIPKQTRPRKNKGESTESE